MFKKLAHFFKAIFFPLAKTWRNMGKRTRIMALLFVVLVAAAVMICRGGNSRSLKQAPYATDSQWIFQKPEKNALKVFNRIGFSDSSQVAVRLKKVIDEYKTEKQNLIVQLADLRACLVDTLFVAAERDSLDTLVAVLRRDDNAIRDRILSLIKEFSFQCIVIGEDKENKKDDDTFRKRAFDRFAEKKTLGRLLGESPDFAIYLGNITCTLDSPITQFEYLKHGLDPVAYSNALYTVRPSTKDTKEAQESTETGKQVGHYQLIFNRQDWNDIRSDFPVEVKRRVEIRINTGKIFAVNTASLDSIRKTMIGLDDSGTGDMLRKLHEDILLYSNARAQKNQQLQEDSTARQSYRDKLANERFLELVHVSLVPDSGQVATVKKDLVSRAFEKFEKTLDKERGRVVEILDQEHSISQCNLDSVKIVGFFEDVDHYRTRYNLYMAFRYGVEYQTAEKPEGKREESFVGRLFHKKLLLAFILLVLTVFLILFHERRNKDVRSPRRSYRDL
jgi:hypothetical protein